ncbi:MAG: polyisoprenoid-binding protein [Flavobacteriaceae bacterium]|nr:polyisoprenoid-binding protein [Flavobacteriaceae bacterium]
MKAILFSLLTISFLLPTKSISQTYKVDPTHTAVLMKVQRFGVVNVIGRFGDVTGTITLDSENSDALDMDMRVGVESYSANNQGGEDSAKSRAFMDSMNFPEITFKLSNAKEDDGTYTITGDLTLHGVTKEVEFTAEVTGPKMDLPTRKQSIAISGMLVINRLDFGVGPEMTLPDGTEVISNRTEIMMEILGIAE